MVKVKVVYMNGKETEYNVEYPKAYIAKIMESENGLMLDQKSVKEIYAADKLISKFTNGFLNELVLEKADEDWNEYQAEILHAQKMLNKNLWVTDHTGGDMRITYS